MAARVSVVMTLADGRTGQAGFCRSCKAPMVWIRNAATNKVSPWNLDGTSHFATCPNAQDWRKPRDGWLVPSQRHPCARPGCAGQANGGKVFCLPDWSGLADELQAQLSSLLVEASAGGKAPSPELRERWRTARDLAIGSLMARQRAMAGEPA